MTYDVDLWKWVRPDQIDYVEYKANCRSVTVQLYAVCVAGDELCRSTESSTSDAVFYSGNWPLDFINLMHVRVRRTDV